MDLRVGLAKGEPIAFACGAVRWVLPTSCVSGYEGEVLVDPMHSRSELTTNAMGRDTSVMEVCNCMRLWSPSVASDLVRNVNLLLDTGRRIPESPHSLSSKLVVSLEDSRNYLDLYRASCALTRNPNAQFSKNSQPQPPTHGRGRGEDPPLSKRMF